MKQKISEKFQAHKKMLADFERASGYEKIEASAKLIIDSIKNGGTVYICGNGGSAADAQHIACELVGRFLRERKALPAIALTTDSSILTAIGNDYGYDDVFARQVEALARPGDVLWAISTSGNSVNVVKTAERAKKIGAKIVAFVGKSNSELEKIADVCLCAEAKESYASQEVHQIAYHIICDLVEENFAKD
ncbi:MAG: SIS domain-containing protein [Anaerohalosphaeraceae bacterium]|nr:SIS domain-containing protein [Anaerohalosphaeraceae bacterium]